MISRIDQQIRVNKIMVDAFDLWKIPNRKLRHYMFNYLEIITVISTIMLIRSGTEENLEKNDLLLTPEYSMNEVTMSGAMLYCGWPYYAWSAGYDTNYRAAQAVTIYTTSDSETLKKTVQQEKITYILFEEGSEFEQQECREETIAAAYEKVYETQDGRIRIYKTTE